MITHNAAFIIALFLTQPRSSAALLKLGELIFLLFPAFSKWLFLKSSRLSQNIEIWRFDYAF